MYTALAAVGVISGVCVGMMGIGGGVIMLPLLIHIGVPLFQAVGIGLAVQMVPQSIFGVIEYYKAGLLNVKYSVIVSLGSAIGIYLGAFLITRKIIPTWLIYRMLGGIVSITGIYILINYWNT